MWQKSSIRQPNNLRSIRPQILTGFQIQKASVCTIRFGGGDNYDVVTIGNVLRYELIFLIGKTIDIEAGNAEMDNLQSNP
jgi:hypothetical protein